jgi:hypothetical protein
MKSDRDYWIRVEVSDRDRLSSDTQNDEVVLGSRRGNAQMDKHM